MAEFNEFGEQSNLEIPQATTESVVDSTMLEIGKTTELNEDDASWLETLVQRIVSPIIDLFDGDEEGFDTERISPFDRREQPSEGIEAHGVEEAVEEWHVQENDYSCAVCSQQFIINEFMDLNLTEEQLCKIAEAQGWLNPELGTSPRDVGNLLELFGIDTHTSYEGNMNDIKNTLDQGGRVIVAVDSAVLWNEGYGNYPVYGMDHAIEVIGIDDSNPNDIRVIINDSGIENGGGLTVSYLEFMEAWQPSGGFMVSAFPNDGKEA